MSFEIDQELLDVAVGLGPIIKEHRAEGESNRRVSAAVIQAMKDAGFVRMMAPASVGGLESDPVTMARVFEEMARFDSAASWILQAANSGDFYCARREVTSKGLCIAIPVWVKGSSFWRPSCSVSQGWPSRSSSGWRSGRRLEPDFPVALFGPTAEGG